MCEINKFLLCCGLETGGKIIGWLSAILSVIEIVPLVLLYIGIPAVESDKMTDEQQTKLASESWADECNWNSSHSWFF